MSEKMGREPNVVCRQAQKRFAALDGRSVGVVKLSVTDRAATEHHLQTCSRCAIEYRLFALQRATLDAAASPEPVIPDEHFYKALLARIARGPETLPSRSADESWAAALLVTARQLFPVMAVLLLLMIGATFLWNQQPADTSQAAVRPRERVMFSDMYDYPAPTRDDVLETLVAVEEK
jgi:anti-sigma factor RsiW